MVTLLDTFGIIVMVFGLTIIWKQNPMYVIAQGIAKGALAGVLICGALVSLNTRVITEGISAGNWLRIVPLLIGILLFTNITRYKWISRYPQVIIMGIGMGVMVGLLIRGQVIANLILTLNDFSSFTPDPVGSVVLVIGFVACVYYFIYGVTLEQKNTKTITTWLRGIGAFFMAITLGNAWGNHTMNFVSGAMASMRILVDFFRSLLGIV